jgi:hypothetical protein
VVLPGVALRKCLQHKIRKTLLRCLLQVADSVTPIFVVEAFDKQKIFEASPSPCQASGSQAIHISDLSHLVRERRTEVCQPISLQALSEPVQRLQVLPSLSNKEHRQRGYPLREEYIAFVRIETPSVGCRMHCPGRKECLILSLATPTM